MWGVRGGVECIERVRAVRCIERVCYGSAWRGCVGSERVCGVHRRVRYTVY